MFWLYESLLCSWLGYSCLPLNPNSQIIHSLVETTSQSPQCYSTRLIHNIWLVLFVQNKQDPLEPHRRTTNSEGFFQGNECLAASIYAPYTGSLCRSGCPHQWFSSIPSSSANPQWDIPTVMEQNIQNDEWQKLRYSVEFANGFGSQTEVISMKRWE